MTPDKPINLLAELKAALKPPRNVYPLYIAGIIRKALNKDDPECIIESIGEVRSLGNSRYAIPVLDSRGTEYLVTVEVVS